MELNNIVDENDFAYEENEENEQNELKRYQINSYSVDRAVETLIKWKRNNKLVVPDFQRDYVWSFSNSSCSNYLNQEEIKYLINTDGINDTIYDLKMFFSGFVGIVKDGFYNQIGLEKKINDYESFLSFYKTSRDTRNKVAHGLINEQVRYDNTILMKFMLSFYVLHKFHLRLFEEINTESSEI